MRMDELVIVILIILYIPAAIFGLGILIELLFGNFIKRFFETK